MTGARVNPSQYENYKTTKSTPDAGKELAGLTDDIFQRFKDKTVPLLEDLEAGMDTRREDFYNKSLESSDNLAAQRKAQADLRQSTMGISMTEGQQTGQSRQESLGRTVTEASATNTSVDAADAVNADVAANLLNISTGIETQAINNLSSAAGLQSTRSQQNIANKTASDAQNQQALGSVASMALMYAMMS